MHARTSGPCAKSCVAYTHSPPFLPAALVAADGSANTLMRPAKPVLTFRGSAVSACCARIAEGCTERSGVVVNKTDAFTNIAIDSQTGQLADWYMGSASLVLKDELPVGIPEHELVVYKCRCLFMPSTRRVILASTPPALDLSVSWLLKASKTCCRLCSKGCSILVL